MDLEPEVRPEPEADGQGRKDTTNDAGWSDMLVEAGCPSLMLEASLYLEAETGLDAVSETGLDTAPGVGRDQLLDALVDTPGPSADLVLEANLGTSNKVELDTALEAGIHLAFELGLCLVQKTCLDEVPGAVAKGFAPFEEILKNFAAVGLYSDGSLFLGPSGSLFLSAHGCGGTLALANLSG